ncbi:MAG: hypothetical protein HZB85_08200 [Deltaproteobacteria bacterium]|nr:hypothetical protein [Deltaproteobacteria bacterium]
MRQTKGSYHYTESGLSNVVLTGVTIRVCSCGEKMPVIPSIEGLHRAIAMGIVKSKTPLTGEGIRFVRKEMQLKAVDLARLLSVNKVSISRWESGKEPIGHANDKLMRLFFMREMEEECKQMLRYEVRPLLENISYKTYKAAQIKIPMDKLKTGALTGPPLC